MTIRLWYHNKPGQWHTVSQGFHDSLVVWLDAHHKRCRNADIVIEYYRGGKSQ